jgi:hypothetical protein
MFRHPCHLNWQVLVRLNGNWALQNFHLEEHKLAKDIREIIDF